MLVRLWREPEGGNVTLSLAADAAPPEVLAAFAKKARLDASQAIQQYGIYERRAPPAGKTAADVPSSDDRKLNDSEPLHFLAGLRESAGKPIVFIVKKA